MLCIPTVPRVGQPGFLSTSGGYCPPPLLPWIFAYAEDGGVEGCGSGGVYDGDLEPVDCAVLLCRIPGVSGRYT